MMKSALVTLALLAVLPTSVLAETLVANRTIRSRTILSPADVSITADTVVGALSHPDEAIGREAKVVLYAGRPVRPEDLRAPALIERNQIVTLVYDTFGLSIATDGRSLSRAAIGESVRVMNLASRTTVSGIVDPQGRVIVSKTE